jgi:hypothetical protein
MTRTIVDARRRAGALLDLERERANERAALAAIPRARLLSDRIVLEGPPKRRLRVGRLTVGEPIARPFSRYVGITRCVTGSADVRARWEHLLALEAERGDDMLRGLPSTVLDIPDATVSRRDEALWISVGHPHNGERAVMAVPRFTFDFSPRKRNNFGHWLLDCVPQVTVLAKVAPDVRLLVPSGLSEYQYATASLAGVARERLVPWDGSSIGCRRLLAFESDGKSGGGRPLSALMELRRDIMSAGVGAPIQPRRRVYFSRRDAKPSRRWVSNEAGVEAVFESRGFEVVALGRHSLEDMARIFRDAHVIAGVNGAGLAHILFAQPGAHVVVLFSDSLIRWHAEEEGARSFWLTDGHPRPAGLAALGGSPRVYAHVAALFEQVCHSFIGEDSLPLDQLARFLDEVLAEADRERPS